MIILYYIYIRAFKSDFYSLFPFKKSRNATDYTDLYGERSTYEGKLSNEIVQCLKSKK